MYQVELSDDYKELEIVAVDISDDSNILPFRLVVVYRPPCYTSHDNAQLFSALSHLADDCVRFCVVGDFNLPYFNWDLFVHPDNFLYNSAADFVRDNGLTQLVSDPTRDDSILDLILCSDVLCCDDVCCLAPLGNSDHSTVSFSLSLSLGQPPDPVTYSNRPNFSKADWNGLRNYFSSVNWLAELADCVSVNQYWDKYLQIVSSGIDEFVPRFVSTRHVNVKLYPSHVRKLLSKKRNQWRLYRRFKTTSLYDKYRCISNLCTKAIYDHTSNVENNLINDGRIGNFYKYVNKKLNGSNGIAPLRNKDGHLLYDNRDKSILLNNYFCSVFTIDNGIIDPARLPDKVADTMSPVFTTPDSVLKNIKQLKRNSSGGPDCIPAEFYKETGRFIAFPLSVIFNVSLQFGDLPPLWKCAAVTPVFKKGSPSDPANYRPISLTCIACKLLESVIKDHIMRYMLEKKIISSHQHGFLSRKSTTTQLLECNLDWNVTLNTHKHLDIIYLDYAKAFDSVVHVKLLAKLSCYGICDQLITWIKNFLVGRIQYVKIDDSCSSTCPVISGVPQGSVLGPVLFILYVNDIVDCANPGVKVKLFADDTKLYSAFDDLVTPAYLQSCLSAITEWSDHWQLKLSPSKCVVLHVYPPGSGNIHGNYTYHIGSINLPCVDSVTDLGITYCNKLKFSLHVDNIVCKASLRAKLILHCFQSRDPVLLSKAFCTFVRPILEYSSVIWNPVYKYDINKIEAVQRRFLKRLNGFYNLPYNSRLAKLGLDSLYSRRVKSDLVMCYKMLNSHVCVDADAFFTRRSAVTRGHCAKLYKSRIVSVRDGNFFSNRIISTWNSLPDDIVSSRSVDIFKRKLHSMSFSLD